MLYTVFKSHPGDFNIDAFSQLVSAVPKGKRKSDVAKATITFFLIHLCFNCKPCREQACYSAVTQGWSKVTCGVTGP